MTNEIATESTDVKESSPLNLLTLLNSLAPICPGENPDSLKVFKDVLIA